VTIVSTPATQDINVCWSSCEDRAAVCCPVLPFTQGKLGNARRARRQFRKEQTVSSMTRMADLMAKEKPSSGSITTKAAA